MLLRRSCKSLQHAAFKYDINHNPYQQESKRDLMAVKRGLRSGIKGMLTGSLMGDFIGLSFGIGFVKGMTDELFSQFEEYWKNPNKFKSIQIKNYMKQMQDSYAGNASQKSQILMQLKNGLDKYGEAYYLKDSNNELCRKLVYDSYCDILSCKNLSNHDPFFKLSYIYPLQITIGLAMKLNYIFDQNALSQSLDLTQSDEGINTRLNQYKIYLNHIREVVYENIYNDKDIVEFMSLQNKFKETEFKSSSFDQYENELELFDIFDMKLCSLDSYAYVYMNNLRRILVPNLLDDNTKNLKDEGKIFNDLKDILFFDCGKSENYWFKDQFKMDRNKVFFNRLFEDIEFDDLWFCDYTQKVYKYEDESDQWLIDRKYNDTNLGLLLKHYLSLGWNLDKFDGNYMLSQALNDKFLIDTVTNNNAVSQEVTDLDYYKKYYQYYVDQGGLNGRIEGPINDLEIQNIGNILASPYSNPTDLSFKDLTAKQLALIKCSLNVRMQSDL